MSEFTIVDFVTSGIALFALVVSGYAAYQYRKANVNAEEALKKSDQALTLQRSSLALSEVAVETQFQLSISSATDRVQQAALALSNKQVGDYNYAIFEQNFRVAQENWLNAHDQACQSYLENKINKMTFKKGYRAAIRNIIVEFGDTQFFSPQIKSPYQSILKCYDEWELQV